ncbi:hypothetical protein NP493_6233g00002 [Ridgeia piscesae]|uniref:Uncharacterized protein n=1 Tax=Ridgeia piscesae TaxID=27915 RepID=A0AAD9ISS1_RIDPI|nr:hypothetical protein NP493_6233g00002 [Ridgeia piscesae]
MRQYTKDNDMMSTQRRMLVGSYHGEKPLLATPSLQWYLSHGLVVDHVYQIIEFQPLSSLCCIPVVTAERHFALRSHATPTGVQHPLAITHSHRLYRRLEQHVVCRSHVCSIERYHRNR